jgi:hypothetical protein
MHDLGLLSIRSTELEGASLESQLSKILLIEILLLSMGLSQFFSGGFN